MAKRQTVWLSTMMILSLMVIGYYTVDETVKPVPTTTTDTAKQQQAAKDGQANNQKKDQAQPADKKNPEASDWFVQQIIKNEENYGKRVEELQKVIADSNTSSDKKVEAEKELTALQEFSSKAESAENKLEAEGYPAALVTKDNTRVNVTVQAPDLTKEQVAKIYMIVSKELGIPANDIVVSYRP
ncbi:SpoIIIAH-like family protein [Effusibacillus pohliae]|uniref:SpoIIIAH-like family protein n=1 Tax=Effusibacillus pohliae TaxID=232270 RepID=UPI00036713D3|nr:SpoIIIAH-like family protein [Effusibacillus pohliae]